MQGAPQFANDETGEKNMLVAEHMTRNPVTIAPKDTLEIAQSKMRAGNFQRLPVVEGRELVGIISDRDLRQHSGHLAHTLVNGAMTEKPLTVTPSTLLERAAYLLLKQKIGGLPVIDGDKLVGIITSNDMLKAFVDLMGASQEGVSRIDIQVSGDPSEIAQIVQLASAACSEVNGIGTYRGGEENRPVMYVRARSEDASRVASALTENSFKVLAVHA
jgi:acetoin utilization protein AcuB